MLNFQKIAGSHTGENLAKLFIETCKLYDLGPQHIISVTQDNASNCKTLASYLMKEMEFHEDHFYSCFLHILNLACQAALAVYDPSRKENSKATLIYEIDCEEDDFDEEYLVDQMKDVPNMSKAVLNV